jgi:arabinan endo-1,5-alpha-L-arabinosidase
MRTSVITLMLFVLGTTVTVRGQQHPRRSLSFTTDTPMVHDPVMAYEDSTYYLFATGMGIQQMTSKDRHSWTVLREPVMTVIPQWAHDSVPGFTQHVWAPDIIRWRGRWWMAYSCSTFGRNGSAIGLLSARSLSYPIWNDEGCIVTSRENRDNWNAIDPNFVIDDQDQPWLVWGSFWDGIQLARLDTTMHIAKGEKPRTIARRYNLNNPTAKAALPINPNPPKNPTSDFAVPNAIEAPFIFKHDGWHYLFVSWDYCCQGSKSNYRVAVGRSKSVDGPYLDRKGIDMRYGGGNLFLEGDKTNYEAAGHCAVYHLDNQDIFICHGYSVAQQGASVLIQRPIRWTEDNWPELQ